MTTYLTRHDAGQQNLDKPIDNSTTRLELDKDAAGNKKASSGLTDAQFEQRLRLARTISLVTVAGLMIAYTLYFARAILLPVTVAVLFNFVLSPLVRRINRFGVPNMMAAGIVITGLSAIVVIGMMQLRAPAVKWLESAPTTLPEIQMKLRAVEKPVAEITEASEKVEQLTESVRKKDVVKVEVQRPSLANVVLTHTTALAGGLFMSGTLLFFLLAAGDRFLAKVVEVAPTFQDKRRVVDTFRKVQDGIGQYLGTVTIINIVLGIVIAIALWLLGVPNAALWGVMATLLNYVPFVGFLIGTAVIFFVSLLTFDSIGEAFVPAAAYLIINAIEANLITPTILGRSMSMNPVAIILWMTFWGWLWGITGAILAVPLLAMVKIACDEVEVLNPVGKFISE